MSVPKLNFLLLSTLPSAASASPRCLLLRLKKLFGPSTRCSLSLALKTFRDWVHWWPCPSSGEKRHCSTWNATCSYTQEATTTSPSERKNHSRRGWWCMVSTDPPLLEDHESELAGWGKACNDFTLHPPHLHPFITASQNCWPVCHAVHMRTCHGITFNSPCLCACLFFNFQQSCVHACVCCVCVFLRFIPCGGILLLGWTKNISDNSGQILSFFDDSSNFVIMYL